MKHDKMMFMESDNRQSNVTCQEWVFPTQLKCKYVGVNTEIDITDDCQKKALEEGLLWREWAWMDVSSIEKSNTKLDLK